ncbi:MAG TPA: hypothetical protein VHN74_11130 [Candidatus Angelobacter sp.]|jgi:drug/metabolite transporter (DMT)-like permease|nr:hypothetical protein [Candidatus Angelobacter sp.]
MSNVGRASVIGLITGIVCFCLLAVLLVLFLLTLGALRHSHPDMSFVLKVAVPVAVLTTVAAFFIALGRFATIDKHTVHKSH